ncbi:hypothetical protein FALCPG4_001705 [Fusarium falciforme]
MMALLGFDFGPSVSLLALGSMMALERYLHSLCRNKVTVMQGHQRQPSGLFREPTAIGACLDPWHLHVLQTSAFWTCNLFVSFSSLSISRLLGLSQDSGPASLRLVHYWHLNGRAS